MVKDRFQWFNCKVMNLFLIGLLIFVSGYGFSSTKNYLAIVAVVIFLGLFFKNVNMLFSIIILLFFVNGTYFVGSDDHLHWLYHLTALVIWLKSLWRKWDYKALIATVKLLKLKGTFKYLMEFFIKDKYLIFAILIFISGIISTVFSSQRRSSLILTMSIATVFVTFYVVPKYLLTKNEQTNLIGYLLFPLNLVIVILGSLNILFIFKLFQPVGSLASWKSATTIFSNSNVYGMRILVLILLFNLYYFTNLKFKNKFKNNQFFKGFIIFSYLVASINLILSGSRAALVALIVASGFLLFNYGKKVLVSLIPLSLSAYFLKDKLFLFTKMVQGSSGRTRFWLYTITEVIPKRLLIGWGSGSFLALVGEQFDVIHMHNSYLNVLMSTGLLGLSLWLLVICQQFKQIFELKRNKLFYAFMLLGLLAYSIFEKGIFYEFTIITLVFWLMTFVIDDLATVERRSLKNQEPNL